MNFYKKIKKTDFPSLTRRPVFAEKDLSNLMKEIFEKIEAEGDAGLKFFTKKFDNVDIENLKVLEEEIDNAIKAIPKDLQNAIRLANENISKFHASQKTEKQIVETQNGVECWQESRPIERIGIYIPGGTAPLFSTVLMLATPAKIAGCREVILCTPPDKNGEVNPAILFAAKLTGVNTIFKVGGAQAIAAMTLGTESIPKVSKIFGPGNQYVTAAKTFAQQLGTSIDLPAGPSELLVLADETCDPSFVAADLLSQAEHGVDSQVICIANSESLLVKIQSQIESQLKELPRKKIAQAALQNSKLILIEGREMTIDFINAYAPEHFIICVQNPEFYLKKLLNAGSVFIGNYTPESAGDYASGTNHTLPTNGFAKAYSGVNLDAFCKKITFQKISKAGLKNIGTAIEIMAEAEGLQAHKNAVSIRLNALEKEGSIEKNNQKTSVFDIQNLIRKSVQNLEPYRSAREEYQGNADVLLDANENPFDRKYNRYPNPYQLELKQKIAARKEVNPAQIFLGNGSDDVLDVLFRAFCEPKKDNIVTTPPTFGMFKVLAKLHEVENREVPLNPNFELLPKALLKAIDKRTKMIFLCSPNNPTGNEISPEKLEFILKNVDCLVVVDEAYIDFSQNRSALQFLEKYPNLIVTQTFSKAWGMAGIRLGMGFASPEIIAVLNKVKMPYNISKPTQEAAIELLAATKKIDEELSTLLAEKNKLKNALEEFDFVEKVFPSAANFFLIRFQDADLIYQFLLKNLIAVRHRGNELYCKNCLRITVGTPDENRRLIAQLGKLKIEKTVSVSA